MNTPARPLRHPRPLAALAAATLLLLSSGALQAQEAAIRKALAERLPNMPKIDEVTPSPVRGLFEVRYGGTEILYASESGDHIFINGSLIDTRSRTDLTEARIEKLLAVDFAKLPIKDAIVIKQGNGSRKMAVFADPNCGYCKRLERDLQGIKDVTIYNFVIPILGPDSVAKARDISCAKDPARAWRAWMVDGTAPPKAPDSCEAPGVDRNLAYSRTIRVTGTPAVLFEDGTRKPGAIPAAMVEQLLVAAAKK